MKYIMGIDLGTTGCKASLFDNDGRLVAQAYREYSRESYTGTLDCQQVWEKAREVIRECNQVQPRSQALCITSFGESVVPVDRRGVPLGECILYTAGGVDREFRELEERVGHENIYQITGHIPHPMYTINRLLWYKREKPEVYEAADCFLFLSSYLAMRLGADRMAEKTHAARTMAYDVKNACWSREILEAAGVDGDKLPPVVDAGEQIGRVSEDMVQELGFQGQPLLISGGQDQPCVALGMGAIHGGDAVYGLGTVECLSLVLDQYQQSPAMEESHLVCAPHVVPGKYLTYGVLYSGGNVIRELRDHLFRPCPSREGGDSYDIMFRDLDQIDNQLLLVPHLFGSGTPFMKQEEGASIRGLRSDTSAREILQATLEGLAFDMKINIETMEAVGIPVRRIWVAGGGAKSRSALQIRANVLGRRLYLPRDVQAGARGVFFIAAKALGWMKDYEEIRNYGEEESRREESWELTETILEPRSDLAEKYRRKYAAYRRMLEEMKEEVSL